MATSMKIRKAIIVMTLCAAIATPIVSFAQSAAGILPTNPFYFLKNWSRGVQSLFVRSPIKRAEMALGVLDNKMEELRGVVRILPESDEALAAAARNYEAGAAEAMARLVAVSPDGAGAQVFLRAAELAGRHFVLTDDFYLAVRREGGRRALREAHEAAGEFFTAAASEAAENAAFFERLKAVAESIKGDAAYLRRAEFFDELAETAIDEILPAEHAILLLMREDALARFAGASAAYSETEFFERAAAVLSEVISAPRRLRMLDGARELVSGEARRRLTVLRQELARQAKDEGVIGETEAREAMRIAEEVLVLFGEEASRAVSSYLDRARFHLKEAEQLYAVEEFAAAFDQASLARSAAEEASLVASLSEEDFQALIDELRSRYDTLVAPTGIETGTGIGTLFAQSEQKIIALSSLLLRGGDSGRLFEGIREAWVMLSTAGALASH